MNPRTGIVADGSCLGNPGKGSYRCVDLATGKVIYQSPFYDDATNNIMEFLAVVRALSLQKHNGCQEPVYSDSQTARAWVRDMKCKSEHPLSFQLSAVVEGAETFLHDNHIQNRVLAWQTRDWGENPADPGYKRTW